MAAGSLGDGSDRRDMSRIVARSWAATEPDKTAKWIAHMADGPPREAALIALLRLGRSESRKRRAGGFLRCRKVA